jgi:hypothetical protein
LKRLCTGSALVIDPSAPPKSGATTKNVSSAKTNSR